MNLSVVIPHHFGIEGADLLLDKCVRSLRGNDETIVLANDGIGYAEAVNRGMALARGNFIIVANNDTELLRASEPLCRLATGRDAVYVPRIIPEPRDNKPRSFFCVPREVYERILNTYGYFLDTRFEMGYFEDDDLHVRMMQLDIESVFVPSVIIQHYNGGGFTMKSVGEQKYFDLNKGHFEDKWQTKV